MSWSQEGVQPERTALAWNRTGLSLLGGALALTVLGGFPGPEDVVAAVVAVAGGLALRTGRRETLEDVRAVPALLAAVAAAATLLATAFLWLVVWGQ